MTEECFELLSSDCLQTLLSGWLALGWTRGGCRCWEGIAQPKPVCKGSSPGTAPAEAASSSLSLANGEQVSSWQRFSGQKAATPRKPQDRSGGRVQGAPRVGTVMSEEIQDRKGSNYS